MSNEPEDCNSDEEVSKILSQENSDLDAESSDAEMEDASSEVSMFFKTATVTQRMATLF